MKSVSYLIFEVIKARAIERDGPVHNAILSDSVEVF